jgi:glycosyltransferase involved in cell wall biosynthesis
MELMGQVDVFALPCRVAKSGDRDGIPVVLMEAMARGRCVISGDIVTIRELIHHERNGIMIPPGDVEAVVIALTRLAKDRAKVERLGNEARLRIENEFDLDLNARRIEAALRRAGTLV